MSANALLLWMSARRQGSWQQFRSAVEQLHVIQDGANGDDDTLDALAMPLYQELRLNLQRLGHAEFFAGAGDAEWRVAPPALAVTRWRQGFLGVLAGARSPMLLRRVARAETPVTLRTVVHDDCPDQILAVADSEQDLIGLAKRAGIALQRDAPASILASIPAIDDPAVRQACALPLGADWKIERFSAKESRWRSATRADAEQASTDLFRFSFRHQRHVLFCERGEVFRVPGQVGKFLVLRKRKRRVLRYDRSKSQLIVPVSCRPPFLVERALILCSGELPRQSGENRPPTLEYQEIPEGVARTAAALLRQEL